MIPTFFQRESPQSDDVTQSLEIISMIYLVKTLSAFQKINGFTELKCNTKLLQGFI